VKVTLAPVHILVEGEADILTLAAPADVTDIVSAFDVAGEPIAQDAFEVIIQVTISLFERVVEV
jgi:hypothetical protein